MQLFSVKRKIRNGLLQKIRGLGILANPLKSLVGARGFEPPTPWSRTRCATRLRYAPTFFNTMKEERESQEEWW